MSTICKCDTGLSSLFVGGCEGVVDITARAIFFDRFDGLGARNLLDVSTAPIPTGVITSAFKNADSKKRFHITPNVMNPTQVENEANNQTFDGGQIAKLSDGTTVITFMVINITPQEAAKYKQLECGAVDMMLVTESGQLIGYATPDAISNGDLFGLPVQNIQVLTQFTKTNAAVANVTITVTLSKSFNVGNVVTVDASDIAADLLMLSEPKGATITIATLSITTTEVTLEVVSDYYGISGFTPIVGLGLGDFLVQNTTTPATITPLVVTEISDGNYKVEYAAQTSADEMWIEIDTANSSANLISNRAEYIIP